MKKIRLAIIGLWSVGRQCAEAIFADQATALAGIVRRTITSPGFGRKIPVVTHINELKEVDAALICVPPDVLIGIAKGLLQSRIPIVECARLHGDAFLRHKSEIHRVALLHKMPAVVGAGYDPGALLLFRSYFALMAPPRAYRNQSARWRIKSASYLGSGGHQGCQESAGDRAQVHRRSSSTLCLCGI